jgi:hypothetical protein
LDKLLNPGLEHVDHVESNLHQLVAAHDGAGGIAPPCYQGTSSCLG